MSAWHYGGQALLEGVMIRGRQAMALAVRAPSGEIVMHEERVSLPGGIWRWPFLRGLSSLWETLKLGMRALNFSANVALSEPHPPPSPATPAPPSPLPVGEETGAGGKGEVGAGTMIVVVVLALLFGVGLFFVVPLLLSRLAQAVWAQALLESIIRLVIVLLYFVLIAQLPDLKRVFAYHGAEHKAVNALESGANLDVEGVRPFSTAHTRCGTAFLLLVVVLSIPLLVPFNGLPFGWRLASRILLVPVIAAVAYELMRLGAEHFDRPVVRALLSPALLLQRLTTRPPDDGMLEVAIAALRRALELDAGPLA
jgi:uncharacterized protein YqhQ